MHPIRNFTIKDRRKIRYVLSDIDDTITNAGRLEAQAYQALEDLKKAGFAVIPVTGRPAGWCDHFSRMWPIDAIVGENGAFYFRYDHTTHQMTRRYWTDPATRQANRKKLDALQDKILRTVPGSGLAADQNYRDADLAIDVCEDVPSLPATDIAQIVALFTEAGAVAKVSSIHVNGWFGDYDKLAMTRILFQELFGQNLDAIKDSVVFIGDSPNDAPMFDFFPQSVGVANVRDFQSQLSAQPQWITTAPCGAGFAELAHLLIEAAQSVL